MNRANPYRKKTDLEKPEQTLFPIQSISPRARAGEARPVSLYRDVLKVITRLAYCEARGRIAWIVCGTAP